MFAKDGAGAPTLDEAVASGDYRVLRRLVLEEGARRPDAEAGTRVALALDCETTGLDARRHAVVELSARRFRFDADGAITKLDRPYTWLEDPGVPLEPAITRITGLRDEDLAGQAIDEDAFGRLVGSADVLTSFNAAFDRPFVERRLPSCAGKAWACALKQVDWPARGFDGGGRSLGWLLSQCGYFHGAHRAQNDVDALVAILGHVDVEGVTACAEMMATAMRPGSIFNAVGAHFRVKDKLKERGYAWDAKASTWWREVADDAHEAEAAWLEAEVYAPEHDPRSERPEIKTIDWFNRFA